jgi:peptidyl-prolyl cis-trans isomerase C
MKVLIAVVLCSTVLLAATHGPATGSSLSQLPASQVVARVNGVELHGDILNDYVKVVLPDFSFHGTVKPEMLNSYRHAALDRMVLHELIYQEGMRRHIVIPQAKIEAEVNQMRHMYQTPEAFEHDLSRRGFTLDKLRAQIRHNMIIAAVIRDDVTAHLAVSDQQVSAYYHKNLERYREPAKVKLREIRIPPGPEGAKQAGAVRAQAAAKNTSENFDLLATKYSKDDYRVMGGEVGWKHRGSMDPDLEKAAFALRPGQLSPVVETKTGYHLLRVEDKHASRLVPLSEVRQKIREQLLSEKKMKLSKALHERVYQNAKVELVAKFN